HDARPQKSGTIAAPALEKNCLVCQFLRSFGVGAMDAPRWLQRTPYARRSDGYPGRFTVRDLQDLRRCRDWACQPLETVLGPHAPAFPRRGLLVRFSCWDREIFDHRTIC